MKTISLSLSVLLLLVGCETGTRYDKNETKEATPKIKKIDESILNLINDKKSATELIKKSYIEEGAKDINHKYDPENPLNGDKFDENAYIEEDTTKEDSSTGGNIIDGLDVKSIRVGYHDTYTRLVLDIYRDGVKAKKVGKYDVDYNPESDTVSVTLSGYRAFSAKIPTFSKKSIVEKIYMNNDHDDSGFKFSIKLRDTAKIKSYEYKNPARLIIDIRDI